MTYGIKLLPLLVYSFCLSKSDLFKVLSFVILSSMRDGDISASKETFSSSSLTSGVLSSEIIIFVCLLNYIEC